MKTEKDFHPIEPEFQDIWNAAKNIVPSETAENDQAWAQFQSKINKEPQQKNLFVSYRRWLSVAAAATIFLLSGYFFFQPKATPQPLVAEHITPAGEARSITLTDGSNVVLAPNSKLTVSITENKRSIKLEGFARFEVARDENAPFQVTTPQGIVTVLGTGFDVTAPSNKNQTLKVFVNHGKVKVQSEDLSQEVILTKNQSVTSLKNQLTKTENLSNNLSVSAEQYQFNNAPLSVVFQTVESFQNTQIGFLGNAWPENAKNKAFSGTFTYNQSAQEIAEILSQALELQIKVIE
jgi:ferric-dicitrate binding protein FerR (iron transport regulator)